MDIRELNADIAEHIAVEFGVFGQRALGFLATAHVLLSDRIELPNKGELIAYAKRVI